MDASWRRGLRTVPEDNGVLCCRPRFVARVAFGMSTSRGVDWPWHCHKAPPDVSVDGSLVMVIVWVSWSSDAVGAATCRGGWRAGRMRAPFQLVRGPSRPQPGPAAEADPSATQ